MAHDVVNRAYGTTAEIAAYTVPAREIVVSTDDYSLTVGDGATLGGAVRIRGTPAGAGYTISVPTNGGTTVTVVKETRRIFKPAGTIATHTITLPPTPLDGYIFELMTSQAIGALTPNAGGGASVNGAAFGMPANSGASWVYVLADLAWYRRY